MTTTMEELWNGELGTSAKVFTDDDLAAAEANGGVIEQGIYVWDLCGNVDFALVNLKLIDNGGSANISGRVATEEGVGIEGVQMSVMSQQVGYPANTITTDNGIYTFQYFPMYNDYTIEGNKNDDWLNGVTTLDLVLIQRHILGLTELDSPYKLIAADASNDERISAIDLIQLRKLILGIYAELPANDSWRFTDADASMDMENPWPFSEFVSVYDLEQDLSEDFVGVKVGDVNGSVTVSSLVGESIESRSSNELEFDIKRTDLGQGEIQLEFSSANFNEIAGFQFTLEGTNISEITNVTSGLINLDDSQVALSNNALAFSWNTMKGQSVNDGVLFTVTARMNNNALAITDRIVRAEAYQGESFEVINVTAAGNTAVVNALAQNEPNPWKSNTAITFDLEKAGQAIFSIYSATGQLVYKVTGNYPAGSNVLTLDAADLNNASGVLYYTIESGDFNATRKMIVLK